MRNLVLSLAAAGSAFALAAPASAQYYPQWEGGRGYHQERGRANPGTLHRRLDNVLRSLGGVHPRLRNQLGAEATGLDRDLRRAARHGLSRGEYRQFDVWIDRLERRVGQASRARYDRHDRYERQRRRDREDW
jgi:hypothetical protein